MGARRLGADDEDQLAFAVSLDRAILTHNSLDFESLHSVWLAAYRPHAGILIAVQRYELHVTRDRIVILLNRLDRDKLHNGIFYVWRPEMDRALAKHYGFMDGELDFIINYDIKYRMGRDAEAE